MRTAVGCPYGALADIPDRRRATRADRVLPGLRRGTVRLKGLTRWGQAAWEATWLGSYGTAGTSIPRWWRCPRCAACPRAGRWERAPQGWRRRIATRRRTTFRGSEHPACVRPNGQLSRPPRRTGGRLSDPARWFCAGGSRRCVNRVARHHLRRSSQGHRSCALPWPAPIRRATDRLARVLPPFDLQPHRCRPERLRSRRPDHPLLVDGLQLADPVRQAPLVAGSQARSQSLADANSRDVARQVVHQPSTGTAGPRWSRWTQAHSLPSGPSATKGSPRPHANRGLRQPPHTPPQRRPGRTAHPRSPATRAAPPQARAAADTTVPRSSRRKRP
jgi:hypothetical protein